MTLDVRNLNSFLAPAPPLPLPKIAELKNQMQDKLFSTLDLAMMFYSIRLTERSIGYLCFYALSGNKIHTFRRLVMGLKSAPYIASRSMQLVLNQKNFELWIHSLEDKDLKKELIKHKLSSLIFVYINDLLVASPEVLGIKFHVLHMMSTNGFKVNKKKCNILCPNVTFLGIELNTLGYNSIPVERRNLLANVRTPRSLAELFCRVCLFSYSSNYIPQFNKIIAPLRKLIKSNTFVWGPVEEQSFQAIKLAVALNFRNYSFDVKLPLLMMMDSSKVATSYMAFQIKEGEIKKIDMYSRNGSPFGQQRSNGHC